MTSMRDPYPFPMFENDDNFQGRFDIEKPLYHNTMENAQQQDPWRRLNGTATLSSVRRSYGYYDPQSPIDDLDFVLKAEYDHYRDSLRPKNEVLIQKETIGLPHGRVLKNRGIPEPPTNLPLNHPLRRWQQKQMDSLDSVHHHQAIEGHHSETTNRGYSRKPDGGYYTT